MAHWQNLEASSPSSFRAKAETKTRERGDDDTLSDEVSKMSLSSKTTTAQVRNLIISPVASAISSKPANSSANGQHTLQDKWKLWAHLPHDTDWSPRSYKEVMTLDSVESTIALCETIPEKMVTNCMLFLMRNGVLPMWEDPRNRAGGCFSYKVANKTVTSTWMQLSYSTVGETLTQDRNVRQNITGITISPKKNFCIIKIWLSDCKYQNPSVINELHGISSYGCLFKKHLP
jgi:hypothetical protein